MHPLLEEQIIVIHQCQQNKMNLIHLYKWPKEPLQHLVSTSDFPHIHHPLYQLQATFPRHIHHRSNKLTRLTSISQRSQHSAVLEPPSDCDVRPNRRRRRTRHQRRSPRHPMRGLHAHVPRHIHHWKKYTSL